MARAFWGGSVFLLCLAAVAFGAEGTKSRIQCSWSTEAEEAGGKFESKESFDSAIPSLIQEITITESGEAPDTSKTELMTAKCACGVALDFAKDCKPSEKKGRLNDYEYAFTCGTAITRGSLYYSDGLATFVCEGPKVSKEYSGGGVVFLGCKWACEP